MSVSRDDVLRTAALARLHVATDRVDAVASELSGILAHMDVLQQVDVRDIDVSAHEQMPLRDDSLGSVPLVQSRETIAPLMRDGLYLVPRLQTHGDNRSDAE
jgi:aspartyl-tRNA(Asn)/glutamyl-tRNA(Gln) amidotransferase subunit C